MKRVVVTDDGELFEVTNLFNIDGKEINKDAADALLLAESMVIALPTGWVADYISAIIHTVQ